ncbi:hypothetical protein D3C80_1579030 [compost metagenome]
MHRGKRYLRPQSTVEGERPGRSARLSRRLDDPVQPPSPLASGKAERLHRRIQHHRRCACGRAGSQRIFRARKSAQEGGEPPARGRNFLGLCEGDDLPDTVCGPDGDAVLAVQHRQLVCRGEPSERQVDQDSILPVETARGAGQKRHYQRADHGRLIEHSALPVTFRAGGCGNEDRPP